MPGASHEALEDAAQEVVLKVLASKHLWREKCPFCNWVEQIAVTRAIDLRRSQQHRKKGRPLPPGDIADPHDQISFLDLEECLEKALSSLPSHTRDMFNMAYRQGMNREEIAEIMGVSVRKLQYHLAEAMKVIRHCLKPT